MCFRRRMLPNGEASIDQHKCHIWQIKTIEQKTLEWFVWVENSILRKNLKKHLFQVKICTRIASVIQRLVLVCPRSLSFDRKAYAAAQAKARFSKAPKITWIREKNSLWTITIVANKYINKNNSILKAFYVHVPKIVELTCSKGTIEKLLNEKRKQDAREKYHQQLTSQIQDFENH